MKDLRDRVDAGFAAHFGGAPTLLAAAPGRVNLIGEHTDYNDGWVLPMAIGVGTIAAVRAVAGAELKVVALDHGEATTIRLDGPVARAAHGHWSNYVRGVASALRDQGLPLAGAEILVAGNVPQGAGLSSSASLELAVGLALSALAGRPDHDRGSLARAGQSAEHHFAGCACGIMDQLVIASAEPGSALLIDCRSLATRAVPLPPDCAVLIVESGIERGLVDGEYNLRRHQCEAAARHFGVAALRDLGPEELAAGAAGLDPVALRRARHVVTENARTLAAADALAVGDLSRLGELMAASHASMREDFEITTPAIDRLAALLADAVASAGGARMTGGGFGGAVIAVAPIDALAAAGDAVRQHYRTPAGDAPRIMLARPAAGAALLG